MKQIFAAQLPPIATAFAPEDAATRAGLIATQILGMALCRFVLKLPPVARDVPRGGRRVDRSHAAALPRRPSSRDRRLGLDLARDLAFDAGAGGRGQCEEAVEFLTRLGWYALCRSCGVAARRSPAASDAGRVRSAAGRPARSRCGDDERLGLGDVERADVVGDRVAILQRASRSPTRSSTSSGPQQVGASLRLVEFDGQRIAHVGHHREVEQLGDVDFVVQPFRVGSVVLVDQLGRSRGERRHRRPGVGPPPRRRRPWSAA